MASVVPSGEPFLIEAGPFGVLLIHGLTGGPAEMRGMGEYLGRRGYTALGIRLAGHSTQPDDLRRVHRRDWIANAEDGLHILSQGLAPATPEGASVFVIGLSLGGVLALNLASRRNLAGVVAMSTPFVLPDASWRTPCAPLREILEPWLPKGPPDWHDPAAASDHVAYDRCPSHAMIETSRLIDETRELLAAISVPVLLIHSEDDTVVPPQHARRVFEKLGTPDKQLLWIQDSGHVITKDKSRRQVCEAATQFIGRVLAS